MNGGENDRRPGVGRCPICQKPGTQAFRPFCSKRCADVDLGRWLTGVYAIPVEPGADADEDGLSLPQDDASGDGASFPAIGVRPTDRADD
ncbi:MAG: DNA gyrase inhibitor YacG [Rhizobiales bacterium]|nr:DNA gyrase inhibitor YacG [Hyphomicrobiales bacterium]